MRPSESSAVCEKGVITIIHIHNFSVSGYKEEKKKDHLVRSGVLTYGSKPFLLFSEDADNVNEDMKFRPASQKITSKIIGDRKLELMRMYKDVLGIGNFKVFKELELIVSDVLDLNEACQKGKARALQDKKPNACLAISAISYGGDDLFFRHFWYSYHSTREDLTEKRVEAFFNQCERGYEKKVFKKHKSEESYNYVKLLKVISFDLRQNVCFE